jgi:hypothetical protein
VTNNKIIVLICRSPDVEEYTTSAAIIAANKFNEDHLAELSAAIAASAEDKPQFEEKVSLRFVQKKFKVENHN